MNNMPEVKIGVVAVSRDCFPESLSVNRRKNLMKDLTISLHVMHQSQVYIILVLRLRKIQNLIYLRALISMQEMKEFLML